MMLKWFPLMFVAIALYNVLIFFGPWMAGEDARMFLMRSVDFPMFSGDVWQFSVGDFVMVVGLAILFIEVVKATRTASVDILNHTLSMAVFIIALIEFIVLPGFSTTPFFFLMAMALFDVVAGFTISIVTAKRDFGHGGGVIVGG